MSKFSEQFTARYKDTKTLRKQTKRFKEEYDTKKYIKGGDEVAKPTKSKLGKRL